MTVPEDVQPIKQIVGRWAQMETGEWVTPVKSFRDYNYDEELFHAAITRFQRDPMAVIATDGIVSRIRG